MSTPMNDPALASTEERVWATRAATLLARLIEFPTAMLVLAEILILAAGVFYRYVLHQPLIWSDELASMLFLWLSMLGAVVAFHRGEHMRMTAIVGAMEPRARAFFDMIAIAAAVAFLAMVLHPAMEYAQDEAYVVMPAMEIPNSWRAAALPVGTGLMLLVGVLKFARYATGRDALVAIGIVGALVLAGWPRAPRSAHSATTTS